MSNTPVDPVVEMLIGSEWVDITEDCRLNSANSGGGLTVRRGVSNEGNAAEPTQFDFTLNNREGKYSPLNPTGPYYGLLGRNQPVRVGLNRIVDTFTRANSTDTLGSTPDKDLGNGLVKPGLEWDYLGASDRMNVVSNTATLDADSGVTVGALLRGLEWADADITVRLKTSNRNAVIGVLYRTDDFDISVSPYYFDAGVTGWVATGGVVSQTTAVPWDGHHSALLVVAGSPVLSYVRSGTGGRVPVVAGGTYRAKSRVRSPTTPTVRLDIDWYNAGGVLLSTSNGSSATLVASTWRYIECGATAPANAAYAEFGPTLTGSPANGTQLVFNDMRFHDYSDLNWYAAYASPLATDRLRINKLFAGANIAYGADLPTGNFVADTWYWLQVQTRGQDIRARWWADGDDPPETWTLTRHDNDDYDDFGVPPKSGLIGFYTSNGPATVTFDSIQIDQWRAHTEIAELPPRYDLSREDRWVPIQSRGILRRLGQGRKGLESPVTRHLRKYASLTKAWWTLESGGSDRAGNQVPGGRQAVIRGLSFGADETLIGVAGVAAVTTDTVRFSGRAIPYTATGAWTHLMYLKWDTNPASDTTLAVILCSGTGRQYRIIARTTGAISIWVFNVAGTLIDSHDMGFYPAGEAVLGDWIATTLYLFQDGSEIKWAFNYHKPGTSDFFTSGTRPITGSVGTYRGTDVVGVANHNAMGFKFTQILGYAGDLPFVTSTFARAARAYIDEAMLTRFVRLMGEAGLSYRIVGSTSNDEQMGEQGMLKLTELLEECAKVGGASLLEDRDGFNLVMRTRASTYIQRKTVLDLDAGHLSSPNEPNMDDQGTRNDVTVTRPDGGSARSVQETGLLNVNEPEVDPDGVGVYDVEEAYNVADDTQLQPIANWLRGKGTQTDPRYPTLLADLTASGYDTDAPLTAEVLSVDLGDTLEVVNTEVSPDSTDQLVQQTEEKIDQYELTRSFVATPARILRVGTLDYSTRPDASASAVETDFDAGTDTNLLVERTSADAGLWVLPGDSPASFPFDVLVAGVRLHVTSASGTSDPQTLVVDATPVNGVIKTIPAGSPVKVFQPWILAW
jgi:hypothetical protein